MLNPSYFVHPMDVTVTGQSDFGRGDRQFVTGSALLVKVKPNPNTKNG
jgi:hypothetical protein